MGQGEGSPLPPPAPPPAAGFPVSDLGLPCGAWAPQGIALSPAGPALRRGRPLAPAEAALRGLRGPA
ncbi:hypothetical protein AB4212_04845, partial [Streptomyces sp. 2MCAF27]